MQYLEHTLAKDKTDTKNQPRNLKMKISEAQGTMDALLLKAATAEDDLSAGFMCLTKEKNNEITVLQMQIEQIEKGKLENSQEPAKILELAQGLSAKYVTLESLQKCQIVHSVFSNLQFDGVTLCGQYRLPFTVLADNSTRSLNWRRGDSNPRPEMLQDKLLHA